LEDLKVDRRIILRRILKKQAGMEWTGSEQGIVVDYFKHGYGHLGFIKGGESLD
jgi:hypothetical protein